MSSGSEAKRSQLEAANSTISRRIAGLIERRNEIEAEIETLRQTRLGNTNEINRLMNEELAELVSKEQP